MKERQEKIDPFAGKNGDASLRLKLQMRKETKQ